MEQVTRKETLNSFRTYLYQEEKSEATVEKYLRDASAFLCFVEDNAVTKELVVRFKQKLTADGYAVNSINSMLASVNRFLEFLGLGSCKAKSLRRQRQIYCPEEKELTRKDYDQLLKAADGDRRLCLLMQTICSTGIRVSELQYFTVEAVDRGEVVIHCKNKIRNILVPRRLKKVLLRYAKERGVCRGPIFVTRSGRPMDRSNIWSQMKKLCQRAGVQASKVFPHNLRKLFAKTFYGAEKDIAKLADILGHSSIDTTRIYIMTTGSEHRQKLEQLGLVLRI